jgi:hypothetical protein
MRRTCLLVFVLLAPLPECAYATIVAFDTATNAAYIQESGGAWKGEQPDITENPPGADNGGHGFLPWNFAGGFHDASVSPYGALNHFIDGVDFTSSAFNNLGSPAFALTNANIANFGFTSRATRVFSQPLTVGGTFSTSFDNPLLAPLHNNDNTGFIIRLNSGSGAKIASNPNVRERLGLFALFGFNQGRWNLTNAGGAVDTGLNSSATATGAMLRITLQSTESYSLEILPTAGGAPLYSSIGNLANPGAGSIDTFEIVMFGNGSGNGQSGVAALPSGQREFFFNDLSLDNPPQYPLGDYNQNGVVDAADYVVWRDTLNQSTSVGNGADGNANGVIDSADYDVWKAQYGTASFPESAMGRTLPEPTLSELAVASAMVMIGVRRRRAIRFSPDIYPFVQIGPFVVPLCRPAYQLLRCSLCRPRCEHLSAKLRENS